MKRGGRDIDGIHFTNREMEIIELLDGELNRKQIASKLGISINTLNNDFANIYRKLNINSEKQLTVWAFRNRVLT